MLQIKNLSVNYNGTHILQDLNCRVKHGKITALIGPNGAGKTTLIRTLSGVLSPSHGQVLLEKTDLLILPPSELAKHIAVVPQVRQVPPGFSVRQIVTIGRTPHIHWLGSISPQDEEIVHKALTQTMTDQFSDRLASELSAGEQQRVFLARALAQDTPILLLDEPTAHLDLKYQAEFLALLRSLVKSKHITALAALHDLNLAALAADHIILLSKGRIACQGTPREVLQQAILQEVFETRVKVTWEKERAAILID